MQKITICILTAIFVGNVMGKSDVSRLNILLKTYDYPEYKISKGDADINCSYSADRTDGNPDQINDIGDELNQTDYSQDVSGNLHTTYKNTALKPKYWTDLHLSVSILGDYRENDHVSGNKLLDLYDTSSSQNSTAGGDFASHFIYERHWGFLHLQGLPFYSITLDNDLNCYDNRGKSYYHTNQSTTHSRNKSDDFQDLLNLKPEVGISLRQPIEPVFRSFEIERKLKEVNAIKDTLSMETLRKLATFIASNEKHYVKHDKSFKYIMKDLDSILHSDSTIDTSKLNAFAYLKTAEALSSNAPNFYCGFRAAFGLNGNNRYILSKQNYSPDEISSDKNYLFLNLELNASYTFPIFSRLFFESDLYLRADTSGQKNYAWNLKNQTADFHLYYFLTDKISIVGSVVELPLKIIVPTWDKPSAIQLEFNYYIEDNMSIYVSVSKNNISEYSVKRSYENAGMGVHYEF